MHLIRRIRVVYKNRNRLKFKLFIYQFSHLGTKLFKDTDIFIVFYLFTLGLFDTLLFFLLERVPFDSYFLPLMGSSNLGFLAV